MAVSAAACSKKTLISSEVKTRTTTVLTDTLVEVKVAVPIKTVELDTETVDGTVVKQENGIKVTVTHKDGRTKVKAETLPDTAKATVKLQNKETTTIKETEKVYEKKETLFKRVLNKVFGWLPAIIFSAVISAVIILAIIYRIKRKLPIP